MTFAREAALDAFGGEEPALWEATVLLSNAVVKPSRTEENRSYYRRNRERRRQQARESYHRNRGE